MNPTEPLVEVTASVGDTSQGLRLRFRLSKYIHLPRKRSAGSMCNQDTVAISGSVILARTLLDVSGNMAE